MRVEAYHVQYLKLVTYNVCFRLRHAKIEKLRYVIYSDQHLFLYTSPFIDKIHSTQSTTSNKIEL